MGKLFFKKGRNSDTKKKPFTEESPIFLGFWCFFCTSVNSASIWVGGWVAPPPGDHESHLPTTTKATPKDHESHHQDHPQP